ncbi:hypothetical protein D7Z54_28495 [Salibacterium salarium]|uniref:Uncharacterized protein n=1 Tax=Salibacterium salarium TaxID=284579 RepID=A0A428MV12_9BACI|nr:hypothetical protein [Salibacterium salarium]RSL29962.1 hypothetical protein D7Z54_28495 [Salibacterium salarium]
MKKVFNVLIEYKWIIFLVIIFPILLSQFIRLPLGHWTIGNEGSWVSFLGNYSGGVLGGIIAFLVARDQIKKQQKQYLIENLGKELPILTGVELECKKVLEQLKKVQQNYEVLWENQSTYSFSLDALIWSRWEKIHLINDPVLQEEMIMHRESLKRNIEVFGIDINTLIEQLEQKRSQERRMSQKDSGFIQLHREISKESAYLEIIKKDKVHYLEEMPYCIEKTEKILSKISKRKSKIHEILKKNDYYSKELLSEPKEYEVDR